MLQVFKSEVEFKNCRTPSDEKVDFQNNMQDLQT